MWTPVQVMESDSGLVLRNVNVFEVDNEEEALSLYFMGSNNRTTGSTAMNKASSRSHAVFSLIVESQSIKNGKTVLAYGKLNLVDLAGSERVFKVRKHVRIPLYIHILTVLILLFYFMLAVRRRTSTTFVSMQFFVLYFFI
jgi:hypothetical protein